MNRYWEAALLAAAGGLAIVLGFFSAPREAQLVTVGYTRLWSGHGSGSGEFREALQRDPASPFRWADLAESKFQDNDLPGARYCLAKAVALGPNVPAILLRAANLSWMLGDQDGVHRYSRKVKALTAQYDAILPMYERPGR